MDTRNFYRIPQEKGHPCPWKKSLLPGLARRPPPAQPHNRSAGTLRTASVVCSAPSLPLSPWLQPCLTHRYQSKLAPLLCLSFWGPFRLLPSSPHICPSRLNLPATSSRSLPAAGWASLSASSVPIAFSGLRILIERVRGHIILSPKPSSAPIGPWHCWASRFTSPSPCRKGLTIPV